MAEVAHAPVVDAKAAHGKVRGWVLDYSRGAFADIICRIMANMSTFTLGPKLHIEK
jgi:hypothetical protein